MAKLIRRVARDYVRGVTTPTVSRALPRSRPCNHYGYDALPDGGEWVYQCETCSARWVEKR